MVYNNLKKKSFLITGGTGSFGQKFIKTLTDKYNPKRVVVYSRDEDKQYKMSQTFNQKCMRYFLGDVRDSERLIEATRDIDIIVHAAALKHVPSSEYNPLECIKTNIDGAKNVINAALRYNVKKIIALSTDKAANPINLYGATKLVSDKSFVSANNISGKRKSIFSIVRYGNVVNSRGSVIPYFKKLIKENKPLTITDEKMSRFLITLQEGVDFVMQSLALMKGGEIFVPKLPSIKILEIAKILSPGSKVKFTGIRPGEKYDEILCPKDESHLTLEFKKYYLIKPSIIFNQPNDYSKNLIGEKGKRVKDNFEYNSKNSIKKFKIDEFKKKYLKAND